MDPTLSIPAIVFTWLLAFANAHGVGLPKCAAEECTEAETTSRADVLDVRARATGAVLAVAFDPDEAPLYEGPGARELTALKLLAIETHETGLRPRLWRGQCLARECDGGKATGEFQLHLGPFGVQLVGDRWVKPCTRADQGNVVGSPDWCITAVDALGDHTKAARVALHMLRGGGLAGYTGQPLSGPAPVWIESVVRDFLAAHPVPVTP
jgi:hypothetical protein